MRAFHANVCRLLCVMAAVLAGCAGPTYGGHTPLSGVPDCRTKPLSGNLRIYIFHNYAAEVFELHDGGLSISEYSPTAFWDLPKEGSRLPASWDTQALLGARGPKDTDEEFYPPLSRRMDVGKWASGVAPRNSSANAVVVHGPHIDRRIQGSAGFSIAALAWNADTSLLAVLEDTYDTTVRGFKDLISPHPVPYADFLLTVYDVNSGDAVCQALLIRDARYSASKIAWN